MAWFHGARVVVTSAFTLKALPVQANLCVAVSPGRPCLHMPSAPRTVAAGGRCPGMRNAVGCDQ